MGEAKYLYAKKEGIVFLKMSGELKYTFSTGFDQFLEGLLEEDDFSDMVFDLTEAEYLDSTNLGLMAKAGEHMLEMHQKKATVISTNRDINEILESVGFDDFFIILNTHPESIENLEEIPLAREDDLETAKMILRAHKKLMAMNRENRKVFEDIVNLLEQDIIDREKEGEV